METNLQITREEAYQDLKSHLTAIGYRADIILIIAPDMIDAHLHQMQTERRAPVKTLEPICFVRS